MPVSIKLKRLYFAKNYAIADNFRIWKTARARRPPRANSKTVKIENRVLLIPAKTEKTNSLNTS